MKTHFLLPNQFKKIGWFLFIPSLIASLLISIANLNIDDYLVVKVFAFTNDDILGPKKYFSFINNSIADELLLFGLVIGGILIGFSKLKIEDEFTSKIRYESLVWATYLNYGLILFFTIFVYGLPYLNVLFFNTFTLLLFFIIRFHYQIYKLNKTSGDDE
ncbi:hypothetical protein EZL74_07330 [Flavobacterium silvisoli]|uniref:Uncharacterized protein n=1 Tax=Flavobacterium silvisoli TaxID=2529433 RepID=A0A4Q9YZ09_9FLAO|nr:hypothetical protein [Flavobacterium silvisoli]TBX69183.1 hypothetical protein EZL74_07330 [Flavobacterium silvisoli]